ncbi:MAG TPA: DUF4272 domain-containing protein [Pyrinomonadaceae bacterium]|jgi:hypothetical protein
MNEAIVRKNRSETILKNEGVPFISSLPVVEDEATANFRTAEEVSWRAMALCLVASKGEGLEQERVRRIIDQYGLEQTLTTKERKFIFDDAPSDSDRTKYVWRYECYWVLLWALGYIKDLGRPDHVCDAASAVKVMKERSAQEFIEAAQLRGHNEILDATDLIYRYDWACVDARLKSEDPPAGLNSGVVWERHYALNWLVGYMDQEWDDVSTDT